MVVFSLLILPMLLLKSDAKVQGSVTGSGGDTLIIDHTTDNTLMEFRFRFVGMKMLGVGCPVSGVRGFAFAPVRFCVRGFGFF